MCVEGSGDGEKDGQEAVRIESLLLSLMSYSNAIIWCLCVNIQVKGSTHV